MVIIGLNKENINLRSEDTFCHNGSIYWIGAHTEHRYMYHIVWIFKYISYIAEFGLILLFLHYFNFSLLD